VAVRYGRRVFANLRKAIVFVIAVHVPIIGLSVIPVLLGWPLILMPVHILFLQLIIDPACSVVFEAEALEGQAMTDKPRSPGMRLFDSIVLARGFWQGAGLLGILLVVHVMTRNITESDDTARAMTFLVLVMSNLGLIHANRAWGPSRLRGPEARNPYFFWISLLTVCLLAGVISIPTINRLFAFSVPSQALLLLGLGFVLLGLAWFELVKWMFESRAKKRSIV
jgi:Ca2+-transporting ATPase